LRKVIIPADTFAAIPDGAVLMVGGFMGAGTPPRLIHRTRRKDS
jgi:acetate CoA/acetoacetate CoA-transferase alpha subunit